jgi:chloramphenicol-sensitive protein RarD
LSDRAPDSGQSAYRATQVGVLCAVSAHVMWGLFPLYWRLLDSISPATLTAHRVVWSFVLLVLLSVAMPRLRKTLGYLRDWRSLLVCGGAAAMIALNWGAFMYAVGNDQVLQASLGYYINPLLNVLLGVVVLGERLKRFQWLAVGSAIVGVAVMTLGGTGVPWIALTVAGAFATYGLLKKKSQLPALEGMTVEMGLLFPIAVMFLMTQWRTTNETAYDSTTWMLLVLGGLVSVMPLALFAVAAKRVTLSTIGILQYVGPTLQWFVGAILFGEPFAGSKLIGFLFVWAGVIVFVVGGLMAQSRSRAAIRTDFSGMDS